MFSTRNRIAYLTTAILGLVVVALGATPASAAASNYVASNLSVTVGAGNVVTAKVTIKTRAGSVTALQAGVCLLSDELFQQPFPLAQNIKLTTTGATVAKSSSVPPGRYHFQGCVQEKAKNWPTVDGPFLWVTVQSRPTSTPPPTATSPVFSGANSPPCTSDFC